MARRSSRWNDRRFAVMMTVGVFLIGAAFIVPLAANRDGDSSSQAAAVLPGTARYPAPALRLTNLNGEPVELADYLGEVVLINNWATWCPPCRAEMPELLAYYQNHAAQGFVIIAINAGEPADDVRAFVDDFGLTFPVWLDPSLQALSAFQNPNLPSSYVLDRDGMVRLAWTGPVNRAALEQYVTPLLER
ncbi:MAG: TlpA disulfide reductase family protein [Anaerolineales bacterium]